MFEPISLSDILSAMTGLLGTLIGAFITVSVSRNEIKSQKLEQLANQEQDINDTEIENKIIYRDKLRQTQEFCFMINSGLRKILSFSNETMISEYERAGVYPPISISFIDDPSALLSDNLTIRLNDLNAYICFYNEMIKAPSNITSQIHDALVVIYSDAQKALDTCYEYSLASSEVAIRQIEKEILSMKIEKAKHFGRRILENKNG